MQVELSNSVGVVERGTADDCAGKVDWFKFGNWCHSSRSPNLTDDPKQAAGSLFCRVLQGNSPARMSIRKTGYFLKLEIVKFNYNAISCIGQRFPSPFPAVEE